MSILQLAAAISVLLVLGCVVAYVFVRSPANPYIQDRADIAAAVQAIPALRVADQGARAALADLRLEILGELARVREEQRRELREELRDMQSALVSYVDKSGRAVVDTLIAIQGSVSSLRAEQAEFRGAMGQRAERIDRELQALFTAFGASRERPLS